MAISKSIKELQTKAEDIPMRNIRGIFGKEKDGSFVSKVDLSALANIVDATLVNKGIVQLQTEINDSETTAATPKAVNTVKAIADANTVKITEIENAFDLALPGSGSISEKLQDVAFVSKANQFTESQTLLAKDNVGTDQTGIAFKTTKFDTDTGAFEPGTSSVNTSLKLSDKEDSTLSGIELKIQDVGRDASLFVNDNAGQAHGIRVHLNKAGDASSAVAFAPSTPSGSSAQEIVTADFLQASLADIVASVDSATDVQAGISMLSDTPDSSKDAATGGTAATPKAVFDVQSKVVALSDVIGTNAENVALLNAENVFTKNQSIQATTIEVEPAGSGTAAISAELAQLSYKLGQFTHSTGSFTENFNGAEAGTQILDVTGAKVSENLTNIDALGVTNSLTVFNADNSASGSISVKFDRLSNTFVAHGPSTPEDASGSELVTADFIKDRFEAVQDNLVDATDNQRGLTLLSDATDSDLDAATGKTAASPKAVKTVKTALDAVTAVVGASAENAALVGKANTFTETQTFQKDILVDSGSVGLVKTSDFTIESGSAVTSSVSTQVKDSTGGILAQVVTTAGDATTATKRETFLELQQSGSSLGKLGIASDDGVSVYTYAPTPGLEAKDTEIATVKYVKDHVGDLTPEHVAYVNVNNVFTESQTLELKKNLTTNASDIIGKASLFDTTVGSFDDDSNLARFTQKLVDKNGVDIAEFAAKTDIDSTSASLSVFDKTGATPSGITVTYDRVSETVTAVAPETASDASGSEIATAKFVGDKITEAKAETTSELQRITNVIGADAENAALVNKANVFTQPQKIQSEDKVLNLGGDGLSTEGSADDALVLGSSFEDSSAEIIIAANGSIVRSEMPVDPDDLEIATVGYVKSLGDIAESLHVGSWAIAMEDYTQVVNQENMEEGVFFSVPFNILDQYIKIDPETGKPAEEQAEGVEDKTVDHFIIMYKAPTSKIVVNLGERAMNPDFEDVPLMSKDNVFTGVNTFKDAQKATPSVDPMLADVNDKSYITKSELVNYIKGNVQKIHFVTEEPNPDEMIPGDLYYLVDPE